MRYESTKRIESKVAEGVAFVLRRINQYKRDKIDDIRRPFQTKARPLFDEYEPLRKEFAEAIKKSQAVGKDERATLIDSGKTEKDAIAEVPYGIVDMPDDRFLRMRELERQILRIDRDEETPAVVAYVVLRIEGLELVGPDGEMVASTPANLQQTGTDESDKLYVELVNAVGAETGLTPEESGNSVSPSISAAEGGEAKPNGSAASAGIMETISGAGVSNTTGPASANAPTTASP